MVNLEFFRSKFNHNLSIYYNIENISQRVLSITTLFLFTEMMTQRQIGFDCSQNLISTLKLRFYYSKINENQISSASLRVQNRLKLRLKAPSVH